MRLPRNGEVVLMDHPMFSDRVVLGKLTAEPTKAFCMVNYFTSRDGFQNTPKRRKLDAVKVILHPEADVASIHEAIRNVEWERDEKIKGIKANAVTRIFGYCPQAEDA